MQITVSQQAVANLSILKQANREPNLAGALIARTVEGLMQIQSSQVVVSRQAAFASAPGAGAHLDTFA